MANKFPITIRMISQIEYGEEVTQEEFDDLVDKLHCDDFVYIGGSVVPASRIEIIYKE